MKDAGYAHIGTGRAAGKDKAAEAARMAISSPLLETSIDMAHGVIVSVIGSDDIGLDEVETAATMVQQAAHPDAHIIFGAFIDDTMDDEIRVVCYRDRPRQHPEFRKDGYGRRRPSSARRLRHRPAPACSRMLPLRLSRSRQQSRSPRTT